MIFTKFASSVKKLLLNAVLARTARKKCWITYNFSWRFIIRLEARLQPNIEFTFERALTVFTRSDITPPKVDRFGRNVEHSKYTVWGWT